MNPKYNIRYTKRFEKELDKLSPQNRRSVIETVKIMENNPYYRSLRTKKMEGRRKNQEDLYESRVNNDIRLIWYFDEEENRIILMVSVGHHDVEKQRKVQRH
jgi:mRNA interferase RelE/StbE